MQFEMAMSLLRSCPHERQMIVRKVKATYELRYLLSRTNNIKVARASSVPRYPGTSLQQEWLVWLHSARIDATTQKLGEELGTFHFGSKATDRPHPGHHLESRWCSS